MGHYPVRREDEPYDDSYFDNYVALEGTDTSTELLRARNALVARHYDGPLVDVGIGCGAFLKTRPDTDRGFDVMPKAARWLKEQGRWCNPFTEKVPAVTMWDVMEHLSDPSALVAQVTDWVFLSLPIFATLTEVRQSKHYKKDEHRWYFTPQGLRAWFEANGFVMRESCGMEVLAGRDSIGSFAFQRCSS